MSTQAPGWVPGVTAGGVLARYGTVTDPGGAAICWDPRPGLGIV